ncbi:MAG: hypothetical protein WBW92_10910, partial [Rhodanobacteraceae bacterium]
AALSATEVHEIGRKPASLLGALDTGMKGRSHGLVVETDLALEYALPYRFTSHKKRVLLFLPCARSPAGSTDACRFAIINKLRVACQLTLNPDLQHAGVY